MRRLTVVKVTDEVAGGRVEKPPPASMFDAEWLVRNGDGRLLFGSSFGGVVGLAVNRESISWVASGLEGPLVGGQIDVDIAPAEGERASPEELQGHLATVLGEAALHLPDGVLGGIGVAWPGAISRSGEPIDPSFHHDGFRDPETNGARPVTPLVQSAAASALGDGAGNTPVLMINDADADLLYELRLGVARGVENVMGVKVCGGLGMSAVHDGRLVRGHSGMAGEIQHIKVRADEAPLDSEWEDLKDLDQLPACWCTNRDCIGRFATGSAIVEQLSNYYAEEGRTPTERGRRIELTPERGVISAVFNRAGRLLGQAMVGPVQALDPEIIVISAFPRNHQLVVGMQSRLADGHVSPGKVVLGTSDVDTTAGGAAQLVIEEIAIPQMEEAVPESNPQVLKRDLPLWLRQQFPTEAAYVGDHHPKYGSPSQPA